MYLGSFPYHYQLHIYHTLLEPKQYDWQLLAVERCDADCIHVIGHLAPVEIQVHRHWGTNVSHTIYIYMSLIKNVCDLTFTEV